MFVVFGLGVFQSFVFSVLLLAKKENKQADKFLAAFFFVVALYLLNIFSLSFDLWYQFPDLFIIHSLVFLSYGPLLFFYVSSLIGKRIRTQQMLAHGIPVLIVFLFMLSLLFYDRPIKMLYHTDKFINLPSHVAIATFLQNLFAPVYFVWTLIILRKHKTYLKNNYSSVDKINLNWMKKLLIGGISIWLIDCLNVIGLNFTDLGILYQYNISWYIKFAFMVFVIIIGYYGINQGSIFSSKAVESPEPIPENIVKENVSSLASQLKNENSEVAIQDIAMKLNVPVHVLTHLINLKISKNSLLENTEKTKLVSDDLAKKYAEELINFTQQEKVYFDSELRIQDIASELKIPIHILSYVINTEFNQNFFDFINSYRIEEVKKRLQNSDYDHLTIIAIAFDCGFNSKATFNRLFKKYTGQTPSQFKQN